MISFRVTRVGRFWEHPSVESALLPAMEDATLLVHRVATGHLRAIGRGPGRFGHVAESLRWSVRRLQGLLVTGLVEPGGKAAFKARFLEFGTRPPKRGGMIQPRRRRAREARIAGRRPVALMLGPGIFRLAVPHPGHQAFQWSLRTQRETGPKVVTILDQAVGRVLNG